MVFRFYSLKDIPPGSALKLQNVMELPAEIRLLKFSIIRRHNEKGADRGLTLATAKRAEFKTACLIDGVHSTGPVRCTELHPRKANPVWIVCHFCGGTYPCGLCPKSFETLECAFVAKFTDDQAYEAKFPVNSLQLSALLGVDLFEVQRQLSESQSLNAIDESKARGTFLFVISKTNFGAKVEHVEKSHESEDKHNTE